LGQFTPSAPQLASIDKGVGLCVSKMDVKPQAAPRLKLLLEFEPAHRVFFRNLADTVLRRPVPSVATTSRPGPFWNDVFVYTAVPWRSFFESVLWHVLVLAGVWTLFLRLPQHETSQKQMFRDSRIVYYAPPKSFPATESRRPRERPRSKAPSEAAHQQKLVVTPEHAHGIVMPPSLRVAQSGQAASAISKIASARPALPAVPLSETGHSLRPMPAGLTSAVAPSPELKQSSVRRLGLPQASAVAPAPEVGAGSARRGMTAPNAAVVAPPPIVQGSLRKVGDINIGHSEAVAPAPELPLQAQRTIPGRAQAGLGGGASSAVVPPPPSVGGSETIGEGRASARPSGGLQAVPPAPNVGDGGKSNVGGRVHSLSTAGMQVVPPTASVDGGGNSTSGRRVSSLSGTGTQVVPPTPSLGDTGSSSLGGRGNLSTAGMRVVPPSPSIGSGDGSTLGGRGNLSTAGMQVVPPSPSIGNGDGSVGNGRGNSLSGAGTDVAPPSSSANGSGDSAGDGSSTATDTHPAAVPSAQQVADDHKQQTVEELPVNLIGLVLALPGTSYFSNYEVFVARRRLGKDGSLLIKLVYEFLPYQRRLSEYDLKNAKVFKLTVVRDTTCDETLAQMLHPQIDESHPGKQYSIDPAVLGPNDPNSLLACYRTTADDFRKAVSRAK
jgi:hypothetical protein